MNKLRDEQWDYIMREFGDLFYHVTHRIYFDDPGANREDYVQDLKVVVLEAISAFERQNDGANGTVDDFLESEGFRKYLKTSLWNYKTKRGKHNQRRYQHLGDSVDVHDNVDLVDSVHYVSGLDEFDSDEFLMGLGPSLSDEEREVVKCIVSHPNAIKDTGSINISGIAKQTNIGREQVERIIRSIGKKCKTLME